MALSVFPNFSDEGIVEESFFMQMKNEESLAQFTLTIQQSAGDFVEFEPIDENSTVPVLKFNGKYENSSTNFNASLQVIGILPVVEGQPVGTVAITNVELLKYTSGCLGYSASKANNTIALNGIPTQVFTDQVYTFLMKDMKTLKSLSPDTTEEYSALIGWVPPSLKEVTIKHSFTLIITYDEVGGISSQNNRTAITTLSVPQTIRWQYYPAVQQFRTILAKGVL